MARCDRCAKVIDGTVVIVSGSETNDVVCKPCWDGFLEFYGSLIE